MIIYYDGRGDLLCPGCGSPLRADVRVIQLGCEVWHDEYGNGTIGELNVYHPRSQEREIDLLYCSDVDACSWDIELTAYDGEIEYQLERGDEQA